MDLDCEVKLEPDSDEEDDCMIEMEIFHDSAAIKKEFEAEGLASANIPQHDETSRLSKEVEEMKNVLMKLSSKISSWNDLPKNYQPATVKDDNEQNDVIMKLSREVEDMKDIVKKLVNKVDSSASNKIEYSIEVPVVYATPIPSDDISAHDSLVPPSIHSSNSGTQNDSVLMNNTVDASISLNDISVDNSSVPFIENCDDYCVSLIESTVDSSITPNHSKAKRNRRNCCPYCEKLVTNFVRHLISNHKYEEEVIKLISITDSDCKEQRMKRMEISSKLRNKGNYAYNLKIVNDKRNDQLLPRKRPDKNKYKVDNTSHVVCKFCYGLFKREFLYMHVKKCKENNYKENLEKEDCYGKVIRSRVLKTSSMMLCPDVSPSCEAVKRSIFPRMEHDLISVTAQSDPLIVKFGDRILKNQKDNYQVSYISVRMRDLARVLIEVKKTDPEIHYLEECIDAFHFHKLMDAIRKLSGYNKDTGKCNIPSLPPRLGPSLKTCADIIRSDIVKDHDLSSPQKLRNTKRIDDFMQLMRSDWKIEVGLNGEKSRIEKRVEKTDTLNKTDTLKTDTLNKKIRRARWSDEEKDTVYQYFGRELLQFRNPERIQVKRMLEKEDALKTRTLEQVCSFINNIVTKKVALKNSEIQGIKRRLL